MITKRPVDLPEAGDYFWIMSQEPGSTHCTEKQFISLLSLDLYELITQLSFVSLIINSQKICKVLKNTLFDQTKLMQTTVSL